MKTNRALNILLSLALVGTPAGFGDNTQITNYPVLEASSQSIHYKNIYIAPAPVTQNTTEPIVLDTPKAEALPEPKPAEDKTWLVQSEVATQAIEMIEGGSRVLRFDRPLARVAISEPTVADVLVITPQEILIHAIKRGAANLIIWDNDNKLFNFSLTVSFDPTPLKRALNQITPNSPLEVFPTEKGFVVDGNAETVEKRNQIESAAKAFSADSVSLVKVNDAKQVLLEIRFIEVTRTTDFEFGIDGAYLGEKVGFTFLPGGTVANTVVSEDTGSPALGLSESGVETLFTGAWTDGDHAASTVIKAQESKGNAKIIARPNILVKDGEEATFLVGGEFPVPIVTDDKIKIDYKEYGTRLKYKPEILDGKKIRLKIESEVSQIDAANSVTLSSIQIPALASRKTETTVELQSGFSLVIGGLIQQRKTESESGTPLLRRIPVLGRLFESTENSFSDVELIVVITPHIIDPKTEAFDLNKIKITDPRHATMELDKPPFENKRALAIEDTLHRFEKDRNTKDVAEDRKLQRDKMLNEFADKKQRKRDEDFYKFVDDVLYDGKKTYSKTQK
jgi:pilus assembly protein CpaC